MKYGDSDKLGYNFSENSTIMPGSMFHVIMIDDNGLPPPIDIPLLVGFRGNHLALLQTNSYD